MAPGFKEQAFSHKRDKTQNTRKAILFHSFGMQVQASCRKRGKTQNFQRAILFDN